MTGKELWFFRWDRELQFLDIGKLHNMMEKTTFYTIRCSFFIREIIFERGYKILK